MEIKLDTVSKGDTDKLIRWLLDPGAEVFERVIESDAMVLEVAAAEHLLIDTDAGRKAAETDIDDVLKLRYVLELMRRIKSEKTFKLATAAPTRFK